MSLSSTVAPCDMAEIYGLQAPWRVRVVAQQFNYCCPVPLGTSPWRLKLFTAFKIEPEI